MTTPAELAEEVIALVARLEAAIALDRIPVELIKRRDELSDLHHLAILARAVIALAPDQDCEDIGFEIAKSVYRSDQLNERAALGKQIARALVAREAKGREKQDDVWVAQIKIAWPHLAEEVDGIVNVIRTRATEEK